jgi:hypothetical protein
MPVYFFDLHTDNQKHQLDEIPTVGPSGRLTSYIGAIRYLVDANNMLKEGYCKVWLLCFLVFDYLWTKCGSCSTKDLLSRSPSLTDGWSF